MAFSAAAQAFGSPARRKMPGLGLGLRRQAEGVVSPHGCRIGMITREHVRAFRPEPFAVDLRAARVEQRPR
eukprot:scaffold5485_cov55-Phaeocystis_antarctica.AAC.1